jgi:Fe-S oxidoreductase
MTLTYDPKHAAYTDEADVRNELTRVFDVCGGCRRCLSLCTSFPSLFEMLDRVSAGAGISDAGRLTPAQQDRVVDECFQCRLCLANCPYAPGMHELAIDFPRLMARARAMRHATGQRTIRTIVADQLLGRTDPIGKLATRAATAINRLVGAEAGTLRRRLLARVTGVTARRRLVPFARRRFSRSLRSRPGTSGPAVDRRVTVFPTCLVEYRRPEIGHALVDVYAHHGIACDVARVGCCGAPWLTAGDTRKFAALAVRNVTTLAAAIRGGTDVVVAQPTCHAVITTDYIDHVGGADAELVAARSFDAVAYLADHAVDRPSTPSAIEAGFGVQAAHRIVNHEPCGRLGDQGPSPARRLFERTGAEVTDVYRCTGVDGRWGLRVANEQIGLAVAHGLGVEIERTAPDVVTGACIITNAAIEEQTRRAVIHPFELLATTDRGSPKEDRDG